jgi:hypothetical protein
MPLAAPLAAAVMTAPAAAMVPGPHATHLALLKLAVVVLVEESEQLFLPAL